jgi:L-alanine-DL-glutamate epimerase-like enolase superfamily enzyme
MGLLHRGKKVRIIVDALGSHNTREAKLALRKMEAKGAKLVQTKDVAGVSHLRAPLPSAAGSITGEEN